MSRRMFVEACGLILLISAIFAIGSYYLDLLSKSVITLVATILVSIAAVIWSAFSMARGDHADAEHKSKDRLENIDPSVAIKAIEAALKLYDSEYDRKKDKGFAGWVDEDKSRIIINFKRVIELYSPEGSIYRKDAEKMDALGPNELDIKERMLMYHGTVNGLRDAWLAGDFGPRRPTR